MSNSIVVTGNTSKRGCELRFTPSGAAAANFSVAGTNRYYDKNTSEFVDEGEPLWFNVTAWRELAEQVAEQIPTDGGSKRVTITGRIKARKYTPKDGGDEREVWDLIADSVCVHPARQNASGGRDNGRAQQAPPTQQQPRQTQPGGGWAATTPDEPPF